MAQHTAIPTQMEIFVSFPDFYLNFKECSLELSSFDHRNATNWFQIKDMLLRCLKTIVQELCLIGCCHRYAGFYTQRESSRVHVQECLTQS